MVAVRPRRMIVEEPKSDATDTKSNLNRRLWAMHRMRATGVVSTHEAAHLCGVSTRSYYSASVPDDTPHAAITPANGTTPRRDDALVQEVATLRQEVDELRQQLAMITSKSSRICDDMNRVLRINLELVYKRHLDQMDVDEPPAAYVTEIVADDSIRRRYPPIAGTNGARQV